MRGLTDLIFSLVEENNDIKEPQMKGVKTPFDVRQRMNLNTAEGTKLRSLSYPPSSPIFLSFSGESCEERKKKKRDDNLRWKMEQKKSRHIFCATL